MTNSLVHVNAFLVLIYCLAFFFFKVPVKAVGAQYIYCGCGMTVGHFNEMNLMT